MSILKRKYILNPFKENKTDRRKFFRNSLGALFGVTIVLSSEELSAMKSNTGYIYIHEDGEVINNFKPSTGNLPYLGEIALFGFGAAPTGWNLCDGTLLNIAQNQALFSLLGISYGGDGITTFGLPDLRGRSIINSGQGPGLSNYIQGQKPGVERVTLDASQIPQHSHIFYVNSGVGSSSIPFFNFISSFAEGVRAFSSSSNGTLSSSSVNNAGGDQPHNNMQPYIVMNYCIAKQGLYPQQG